MENNKPIKITVAGAGYVGLSIATLLSKKHNVHIIDVIEEKINMINNKISPIKDDYIEKYLKEENLNLIATKDEKEAYSSADFVIVAVPTDYNSDKNCFDTSKIEEVIELANTYCKDATIVIKSTIPVGYTRLIREKYDNQNIIFSPEFLRESYALYDNLYPSRIVIGTDINNSELVSKSNIFASILKKSAIKKNIEVLIMGFEEAESVKLFANSYLALRVAFFNELDTYSETNNLNTQKIIEGVCLDTRIGNHYNNPSFGYGGYCLPKDTKQLLSNYENIPQKLIKATVESNETRIDYISKQILNLVQSKTTKEDIVIGIYRLSMKSNSDNFRESSINKVIEKIKSKNIKIIVYEPKLKNNTQFENTIVVNDLNEFKKQSIIIVANRYDSSLDDVYKKVYTRDIFKRD